MYNNQQQPNSIKKSCLIEDYFIRQKKKTLRVLKEVIDSSGLNPQQKKVKDFKSLESLTRQIRLQNMKSLFFKKINKNNIFSEPCEEKILSKEQKDSKRLIKWKGYRLKYHRQLLSLLYFLEMIFLIFTFVCSSFMAFIDSFLSKRVQESFEIKLIFFTTMTLCMLKMIVNSTQQKVRKGILLKYIGDIFEDYVRSWIFFVDFIYFWIVFMVFESTLLHDLGIRRISMWLFLISTIRMITLNESLNLFRTTFIDSYKKDQYYKLFKLTIFNMLFAHFIACMILWMTRLNSSQNWIISKNLQHQNWHIQYIWSFYWGTTIMTSVGFGDISAVTYQEAYVVAFLELFSCIILAYNISEIGNVIYAMRLSEQHYIAKVATFKRMAEQNQTNHELKIKIESYLRQEREIKEKFEFNQQNELLNCLPQPLRKEFILESNGRIFRCLPFFKNLQKNTLLLLAEAFTNQVYYPGENLIKAHQYNSNIMILKEGKVGLVYKKWHSTLNGIIVEQIEKRKIETLNKDGEKVVEDMPILLTVEFLSPGKSVNYDMNAITYSYVSEIKHYEFFEVIKKNDVDVEFFFGILHSKGSEEKEWSQLICERCSEDQKQKSSEESSHTLFQGTDQNKSTNIQKHNKFQCPKLHYFPWKGLILQKYIKTEGQQQKRVIIYNRRKNCQKSCFLLRKILYKKYEAKRFIKEKKNFEKRKKQSIQKFEKQSSMMKKQGFDSFSKRKKSISVNEVEKSSQKVQKMNKPTYLNLTKTSEVVIENEWQQFLSEQRETKAIIENAIKQTIDQVIPKNISLHFWEIEIDCLANYQNYFPFDNAARIDNLILPKNACQHKKENLVQKDQESERIKFQRNFYQKAQKLGNQSIKETKYSLFRSQQLFNQKI